MWTELWTLQMSDMRETHILSCVPEQNQTAYIQRRQLLVTEQCTASKCVMKRNETWNANNIKAALSLLFLVTQNERRLLFLPWCCPTCWSLTTILFTCNKSNDFMLKPFLWRFPQNRPSRWTPSLHPTPRLRSSSSGNLPTIPTETSLTTWSFASASLKPVSFTSSTTVRRVSHIVCSTSLAPVWEVLRATDCFVCLDCFREREQDVLYHLSISQRAYLTPRFMATSALPQDDLWLPWNLTGERKELYYTPSPQQTLKTHSARAISPHSQNKRAQSHFLLYPIHI